MYCDLHVWPLCCRIMYVQSFIPVHYFHVLMFNLSWRCMYMVIWLILQFHWFWILPTGQLILWDILILNAELVVSSNEDCSNAPTEMRSYPFSLEYFVRNPNIKHAINTTYLKSNLDLSNFTCTSLLSSTQNSIKTESLLSYHLAVAGCLVKQSERAHQHKHSATPSILHSNLKLTVQELKSVQFVNISLTYTFHRQPGPVIRL